VLGWNLPFGQSVHPVAPAKANLPAAHASQPHLPGVLVWNLPDGQALHADALGAAVNLPCVHAVQLLAPLLLNWPHAQPWQEEDPETLIVPARHTAQVVEAVAAL